MYGDRTRDARRSSMRWTQLGAFPRLLHLGRVSRISRAQKCETLTRVFECGCRRFEARTQQRREATP